LGNLRFKTKNQELRFAQQSFLGTLDLKPRIKNQDLLRGLWGILVLGCRNAFRMHSLSSLLGTLQMQESMLRLVFQNFGGCTVTIGGHGQGIEKKK
jgi:hypothetical protein